MTDTSSRFCDVCGAANTLLAMQCFACHEPLQTQASASSLPAYERGYTGVQAPDAPVSSVSLRSGSLLKGRYRLIREVGQGGFGVVYQAEDLHQNQMLVAVKQINLGQLSPREIIDATDSYNREVSLLSRLRHEHLPRIYDHFTDPHHWYLVMEFIEGETLEDSLQSTPSGALSLKETLSIGRQLCDVLHYLHTLSTPIIFRDVKPANIMRTSTGRLYLIDFGIARRFVPGRRRDTGALGSPGYAAPEQYGLAQTTAQSDIYSLGATLQTLVTGKEPLSLQMTGRMLLAPHSPLFERLLDQMLEQDIGKRPKSMATVKVRLERIRRGNWWPIRSYLSGLLLGLVPWLIEITTLVLYTGIPNGNDYAYESSWLLPLECIIPLVILGMFIWALILLFIPLKRFFGLGLLTPILVFFLQIFLPLIGYFLNLLN